MLPSSYIFIVYFLVEVVQVLLSILITEEHNLDVVINKYNDYI